MTRDLQVTVRQYVGRPVIGVRAVMPSRFGKHQPLARRPASGVRSICTRVHAQPTDGEAIHKRGDDQHGGETHDDDVLVIGDVVGRRPARLPKASHCAVENPEVMPSRFGYLQHPTARSASEVRNICARVHPESSDGAKAVPQQVEQEARLAIHQEVEQVGVDVGVGMPGRFGILQPPTTWAASEVRDICTRGQPPPCAGYITTTIRGSQHRRTRDDKAELMIGDALVR